MKSSKQTDVCKNAPLPRKRRGKAEEPEFPVQPATIQVIKTPRGTMNHSYRDFSQVPPQADYEHPKEIKDMTFSQKVHHILSQQAYEKWISWMPHGRAFKVHVPVMFESQVCPKYFNHKRYSSFLRELNNYGFKHVSKGTDRNSYYHEFMLKDRPHLCQYMPPCRDARRLVADPANEPNFFLISRQYPLDGQAPGDESGAANEEPLAKRARVDTPEVAPSGDSSFTIPVAAPAPQMTLPTILGSVAGKSLDSLEGITDARILLAILEAKQKQEREERQRALLAASLTQQQSGVNLTAALSLFSSNRGM